MSKLLKCKIDVMKIRKDLLFEGAKGIYLDIDVWISEEPDQYGNDVSIQQQTKQGEPKIYIGNGKTFKKKEEQKVDNMEGKYQKSDKTVLDATSDTVNFREDLKDIPF